MASHPPWSGTRRALVGALLAGAALVCACGARGPLDITIIEVVASDAAVTGDVQIDTSSQDAFPDVREAMPDVQEAAADTSMGMDGGPLVNCGTCVAQNCGNQLLTCVTAPGCTAALQCVATMCVTGGVPDLSCVTGCTMGNNTTESQLLSVFGCVIGTCGTQCTGLLGGLGGGGGGG
jgi:hypothetical protein